MSDIKILSDTSNSSAGLKQKLSQLAGYILWPLGILYHLVTDLRNHLYNIQYKRSIDFTPFIIGVGNLNVGGTGKSPMIEYLVRLLHSQYALAILSRGYKRKTHGVRIAGPEDTAETLGDEPFQFYRKFSGLPQVTVAVGEERVAAVPEILFHYPDTQIILLDDAFQHRAIVADFQLLLTSYQQPFYKDYILPVGRLREGRKGVKRADVVLVTKCPVSLPGEEQERIRKRIQSYAGDKLPVFFAGIRYENPLEVFKKGKMFTSKVILFSGLADASVFEDYVLNKHEVLAHIRFSDHHRYNSSDIRQIRQAYETAGSDVSILTTEKDMVKLIDAESADAWKNLPLFYLPIQTYFLGDEDIFKNLILQRIQQYQQ